jgi:hypothetical protein
MEILKNFMSKPQLTYLQAAFQGEEGKHFMELSMKLKDLIAQMPGPGETDSQDDPTISLHYFMGGSDWWILERDVTLDEQHQAFGLACLNGDVLNAELGYISIKELISFGVELDLYFEPITLKNVKSKLAKRYNCDFF